MSQEDSEMWREHRFAVQDQKRIRGRKVEAEITALEVEGKVLVEWFNNGNHCRLFNPNDERRTVDFYPSTGTVCRRGKKLDDKWGLVGALSAIGVKA